MGVAEGYASPHDMLFSYRFECDSLNEPSIQESASGVFGCDLLALYKTKSEPDKSSGREIVEFYKRVFFSSRKTEEQTNGRTCCAIEWGIKCES